MGEESPCWLHPVSYESTFACGTRTPEHIQVLSPEAATVHAPALHLGPGMMGGMKALMGGMKVLMGLEQWTLSARGLVAATVTALALGVATAVGGVGR